MITQDFCPLIKNDCKEDACQWWDKKANMCAVRELAETTDYIGNRLDAIRMEIASRGN
jgi:hypothetical protein